MRPRRPAPGAMGVLRIFALLIVAAPLAAPGADRLATLRHDAQACASAWNRGSYPQVVSCLSRRLAPDSRARETILLQIRDALGGGPVIFDSVRVTVGAIDPPRRYHSLYASLFPVFAVAMGGGMKFTDTLYVVGVSEDAGRTWNFVPLNYYDQPSLNDAFPEFEGRLLIPPETQPVISSALSG
jgi:hypothetical protein